MMLSMSSSSAISTLFRHDRKALELWMTRIGADKQKLNCVFFSAQQGNEFQTQIKQLAQHLRWHSCSDQEGLPLIVLTHYRP